MHPLRPISALRIPQGQTRHTQHTPRGFQSQTQRLVPMTGPGPRDFSPKIGFSGKIPEATRIHCQILSSAEIFRILKHSLVLWDFPASLQWAHENFLKLTSVFPFPLSAGFLHDLAWCPFSPQL